MAFLSRWSPKFWKHGETAGAFKHLFNFRRIFKVTVLSTAFVSLVPLITMTAIDYNVTRRATVSANLLRAAHFASNTWRTVSYFLTEHKLALDFIVQTNTYEELQRPGRLDDIKDNLHKEIGRVTDLGLIDSSGRQNVYAGPYELTGRDYSNENWFKEVVERGLYISDVFMGFRRIPHIVIAVRQDLQNGSFYVLRATLDMGRFNKLLSELEVGGEGDAFLVNQDGLIQTPSRRHGNVLDRMPLAVPPPQDRTEVFVGKNERGEEILVGYAYIPKSPFILMVVQQMSELMRPWYATRLQLIGFLGASITVILVVILAVAMHLVNNLFEADKRRVLAMHEMEYTNKMASIGRLAAGVAHEINNPLAIINEKAGLIKDLFLFGKKYAEDPRLMDLADSILVSVDRCGTITKRLLSFARAGGMQIKAIDLGEVIFEVLGFLGKEADYRSIRVTMKVADDIPRFETDRGKLQQVFLNIINNAFAAMTDGGSLNIDARRIGEQEVEVRIADSGCGIAPEDLDRIFEPFFSTKAQRGGTGLGLAITYSLVRELGGKITVESKVGKGTTFLLTLPLAYPKAQRRE